MNIIEHKSLRNFSSSYEKKRKRPLKMTFLHKTFSYGILVTIDSIISALTSASYSAPPLVVNVTEFDSIRRVAYSFMCTTGVEEHKDECFLRHFVGKMKGTSLTDLYLPDKLKRLQNDKAASSLAAGFCNSNTFLFSHNTKTAHLNIRLGLYMLHPAPK